MCVGSSLSSEVFLLSAAGPYSILGERVMTACIESGTHYVDITGEVPWDGATPMQVIFAVGVQRQRLPLPPSCPEAMQGLVERCWAADPGVRPGFPEILQSLLVERRRALAVAGVQPRP